MTPVASEQDGKMRRTRMLVTLSAVMASVGGTAFMPPWLSCFSHEGPSLALADDGAQQVFNNACRTCHTLKEGDNRFGPNLFRIIGRRAGSLPQYDYSVAMKDAGFIWDETNLAHFIANPDEVVPGNKMKPYSGVRSADDAKKIVAFLVSISSR